MGRYPGSCRRVYLGGFRGLACYPAYAEGVPRRTVAVALGHVAVALGMAVFSLSWWNTIDATLVALIAAATAMLFHGKWHHLARAAWLSSYRAGSASPGDEETAR